MKKLTIVLFAIATLGIFTFTACGNDASSEHAKEEVNEATDAVGDAMQDEKDDLKQEINDATADIDRRIEKLKADMANAKDEAKAEMQEEINQLEAKRQKLAQNLDEFGDKTEADWEQFKANVRETIKDMGDDNKM